MTTTYNNILDRDKDFQNLIEEGFNLISEQIKSFQETLDSHRQDFNYKLSYFERLLSLHPTETEWLPQYRYESCLMGSVYDLIKIIMLCFGVKELLVLRGEFWYE